jgi:hypothetical protein
MMMGNCGFGMMWLDGLTWLPGLVLLVSLIVLSWTAITGLRRHGADAGAQRRPSGP